MPSLAEVQAALAEAVLDPGASDVAAMVIGDGVPPAARVAIYRHHVFTSLTAALRSTYPVVCRLVGEGFFAYAAHGFIAARPPTGPCLFEYGESFAGFLAGFPACRELAYLADIARLEWALNRALHAEDTVPLDLGALRSLDPQQLQGLTFGFDPSVTLLSSPWPIDAIWSANQADADGDVIIDARQGPVTLQIRRLADAAGFCRLGPGPYALRRVLIDGGALATAAHDAAAVDDGFDLTAALHELFTDNVLTSFRVASRPEEIL